MPLNQQLPDHILCMNMASNDKNHYIILQSCNRETKFTVLKMCMYLGHSGWLLACKVKSKARITQKQTLTHVWFGITGNGHATTRDTQLCLCIMSTFLTGNPVPTRILNTDQNMALKG